MFYLQLTAQDHLIFSWSATRWIVSCIYDKLNCKKYVPTPGMRAKDRDISELGQEYENVADALHIKFKPAAYPTLARRFGHQTRLANDAYCLFCSLLTVGF